MRQGRLFVRLAAVVCCSLLATLSGHVYAAEAPAPGAVILQDLRSFRELGSVLYVAAHPDDENNQLLAFLARGRALRTAYLALNRGEGGQNELGPVFGFELGVVRTQELLAARSVDGARQYFTRVFDFGYSKTPEETLRFWDHQKALGDVVRIIREFRPDVVIARFPPPPSNTHGHHTASTILAQEAFKICGDPKAYPEQIAEGLQPWQPKRLLLNGGGQNAVVRLNIGGSEASTGESFGSIAGRARSMHKTQFGLGAIGGGGRGGAATESFSLLDGEAASQDILDGVDTTWARFPGGTETGKLADEAITQFNPQDPAASVNALLAVKSSLATLPNDPLLVEKRAQLDRIIAACLGLTVKTSIADAEVYPGEVFSLNFSTTLSAKVPVRWDAVRYAHRIGDQPKPIDLTSNQPASRAEPYTLPANTPVTDPYWLKEAPGDGIFRVDDPSLIGRPENPPVLPLEYVFTVDGQTIVISDGPKYYPADTKVLPRNLAVIPFVTLHFTSTVKLFAPSESKKVEVELTNNLGTGPANGTLQLNLPTGWKATPASLPFTTANKKGDKTRASFTVTAPAQATKAVITATAEIGGMRFNTDREELKYDHIPLQLLQPRASTKVIALDMKVHGSKVGYLPGAGDDVAACLEQMGYTVTQLTGADLTVEKLRGFDAVVIGVRAFNERRDLADNLPGLFAYVEQGGTVIAQYNRPGNLPQLGPYNLSIAGAATALRVTDETAPVTILAPEHPALTTPNKITAADFDGWVQERSAYLPSSWDQDHYVQLLAMSDPGETQPSSSILVTQYGKGYYVYTAVGWYRQLPGGVPGAYRLFANLVSLGK